VTEFTKEDVNQYIELELNCKALSSKPETTISDLGHEVTIWNVKTDKEGSWWVATGGGLPMNLYPQDKPYFFTTDEVFSFHLGLMRRVMYEHESRPQHVIDFLSGETATAAVIRRMLELIAEKLRNATELEEIQSIGVMCREVLLKQIEIISQSDSLKLDGIKELKKSDFKNRAELILKTILPGKRNKDLRKITKNLAFGAWDLSNTITHSKSGTEHEAGVCLTLCTAFITSMEHLLLNYFDILADERCRKCGSKRLFIAENDENDLILVICELCNQGYPKLLGEKCIKCGSNQLTNSGNVESSMISLTCGKCRHSYSKEI
jgi:hypothetical protein